MYYLSSVLLFLERCVQETNTERAPRGRVKGPQGERLRYKTLEALEVLI
jgi:hypothetical protein